MVDGSSVTLRSRAAWAYTAWSHTGMEAMFIALPGSPTFTVNGAQPAANALLLSAGAEFKATNGVSLASWIDGEFADGGQAYTGNVSLRYAW